MDEIRDIDDLQIFCELSGDYQKMKAAWDLAQDMVLKEWIRQRPGTRPKNFYKFSAPRDAALMAGTFWSGQFPIMRTLLSGAGCPIWEKADHVPSHDKV